MSPRRARAVRARVGDDPGTALREHLVDTAEKLLGERQLSTITTRDIARAAGVSDGVLYNYFADKHELIIAALMRRYAQALSKFDTELPQPGTGTVEANLITYAKAAYELVSEGLPMTAGLISEPQLLHRFIAEIHSEPYGPQRMREPIAAYLAGEQELGRLGDFTMEAALTLIIGPVIVLGISELVGGVPRQAVTAQLPEIIRSLLRGIGPTAISRPGFPSSG
jgi:AcrR family transcriptional regulator